MKMNQHNNSYRIPKEFIFGFICFAILLFMAIIGVEPLMLTIVFVFSLLCCFCLKNINKHIFFLLFLFSFFIFLVSGDLVEQIFEKSYWLQFSDEANRHSQICILISLIFMGVGYIFVFNKNTDSRKLISLDKKSKECCDQSDSQFLILRKLSALAYYCFYIILLINTINLVIFVQRYGYVESYLSYTAFIPLPSIISEMGDFAPIALIAFLATFPNKKESMVPLALYFLYGVLSLFAGGRSTIIYTMAFLFGYILYRNKYSPHKETWIKTRTIVMICAAVPFLLIFLQLYEYIRVGAEIQFVSLFDSLLDFFVSIGSSSKVIKYGYVYQDTIAAEFRFFSFGETLNYLKYSPFFNWGAPSPATHTVQYAMESHSFAHYVSYLTMPEQFLKGHGMGSSFIAILFADFGYVGVAIGSCLYGLVFKSISQMKKDGWLIRIIKLYMLLFLFAAPRDSYDGFIACIFNIKFALVIGALWLCATLLYNKQKKKL